MPEIQTTMNYTKTDIFTAWPQKHPRPTTSRQEGDLPSPRGPTWGVSKNERETTLSNEKNEQPRKPERSRRRGGDWWTLACEVIARAVLQVVANDAIEEVKGLGEDRGEEDEDPQEDG